jgi:hypothetical protein
VEALRKKEREEYETQFTIKIGGKTSLGPSYAFDALLCRNWLFLASNRFDFTSNFNIVWIYRENFGN